MKRVTFPLKLGDRGDQVANLHKALERIGARIPEAESEASFFSRGTQVEIKRLQARFGLEPTGEIDQRAAARINRALGLEESKDVDYSVQGSVTDPKGKPLSKLNVRIYDREIGGKEKLLGAETTNGDGEYFFSYSPSRLPGEKQAADILVRVFENPRARKPLVSSQPILSAASAIVVNLTIGETANEGISEFSRVRRILEPLLKGLAVKKLNQEDIDQIANRSKLKPAIVSYYVSALIDGEDDSRNVELLYGLYRLNTSTALVTNLQHDTQFIRDKVEEADAARLIDMSSTRLVNKIINELKDSVSKAGADGKLGFDTISKLMNSARLTAEERQTFISHYFQQADDLSDFWKKLDENTAISRTKTKALRTRVEVNTLLSNHVELTEQLITREKITQRSDLAGLSADDIETIMRTNRITPPEEVEGEDEPDRRSKYAKLVARNIEYAMPTPVMANRWKKDDVTAQDDDVVRFFDNNAEFEFDQNNVNELLLKTPGALRGIRDKKGAKRKLRQLQNLFRITPDLNRFDAVKALWKADVRSAHRVKLMGEKAFVSKFENDFGSRAETEQAFAKASKIASKTNIFLMRNFHDLNTHSPDIVPKTSLNSKDNLQLSNQIEEALGTDVVENLGTLLGGLDFCDCEHCESVLSPAAYLVDLLVYLDNTRAGNAADNKTGLEELMKRRPDILFIELSCENSLTPLPYIDLVNEILEAEVASESAIHQTGQSDPEVLQATPEHLSISAYEKLSKAIFPWNLPFNLWLTEARTYLGQLAVNRAEMMQVFTKPEELSWLGSKTDDAAIVDRDIEIASEALGISGNAERELITIHPANDDERKPRWGIKSDTTNSVINIIQSLSIREFINRVQLTYEELQQILRCEYVNAANEPELKIKFSDESGKECSLDEAEFEGLGADKLDRFYRLIRLQKTLNLNFYELDKVLRAFPTSDMKEFLVFFHIAKQAQLNLGVEFSQTLLWWSNSLDTHEYKKIGQQEVIRSDYAHVFLNPAVFAGGDTTSALRDDFLLNAEGTELISAGEANPKTLDSGAHRNAVLAACRLDDGELQLIIEKHLGDSQVLNLVNLSHIYRVASFAHALDLPISEYYLMTQLFGGDPVATPAVISDAATKIKIADGRRFIEFVELIKQSPFDIADLGYLLLNDEDSVQRLNRGNDRVLKDLEALKNELLTADDIAVDPNATDVDQPLNSLESFLAELLSLSLVATQRLVDGIIVAGENCRAVFLSDEFLNSQGTNFSVSVKALFIKLSKAAFTLNKFDLSEEDQTLIASEGVARASVADDANIHGFPDFNLLPTVAGDDNLQENLAALILFISASQTNDQFFNLDTSLYAYLDSNESQETVDKALESLSVATGWGLNDLKKLKNSFGFALESKRSQHAEWVVILGKAFSILNRLGVSAAQAWEWGKEKIVYEQAQEIRLAVKAKYDPDEWLTLAPSLRDPMREQQRNALLSFVGHKLEMTNSQVFSHFLVDAETNSPMDTSRIKLAISSVQLFVQRALLNLKEPDELDVHFSDEEANEWQWRKNYRVWEANRRVYMYPENWIYPELRDDKTPLFRELESVLAQSDITDESAERAYLGYLESLRQIANLEIIGLYDEKEEDSNRRTIHVIGRTRAKPARYYYRRWGPRRTWTAWEEIDAGIDAEHVVPIVHNRRLFLFWPQYTEVAVKPESRDLTANSGQTHTANLPKKYSEIRMAWSHNKFGQWSEMRVSEDAHHTTFSEDSLDKENLYFYGKKRGKNLYIYALNFNQYEDVNSPINPVDHAVFNYIDATDNIEIRKKASSQYPGANGLNLAENLTSTSTSFHSAGFNLSYFPSAVQVEAFPGSEVHFNQFRDRTNSDGLQMWSSTIQEGVYSSIRGGTKMPIIQRDTKNCKITVPNQYNFFSSNAPFVYADSSRTFFVIPHKYTGVKLGIREIENSFEFHMATSQSSSNNPPTGTNPIPGDITVPNESGEIAFNFGSNVDLLNSASEFAIEPPNVSDNSRTAVITSGFTLAKSSYFRVTKAYYRFLNLYHPFVSPMFEQVNRFGVKGLLSPTRNVASNYQLLNRQLGKHEYFKNTYSPASAVFKPFPVEEIDFSERGSYSQYNWELFFHAPLYIADNLRKNQKFEEAQKWFHYIFDPTLPIDEELNDEKQRMRFWKIKPFFNFDEDYSLEKLLSATSLTDLELEAQIEAWEQNPFNPHLIARMRIVAYMKTVVMKYIDNLVEWGDQLFRRDSIESINEATQLYVLAMQLLGPAPVKIEKDKLEEGETESKTFASLGFKDFDEALEGLESNLSDQSSSVPASTNNGSSITNTFMYFCLTPNEKLLTYWDTVADRLFKIRNGMNIEGVRRALRLFQPRLNPGMLVRASAAGVDIASVIDDAATKHPHYRFSYMLQVAKDFCSDVRSLGGALLQALEKKDGEGMQLLASRNQIDLLKQIRDIKLKSIDEAEAQLDSLEERKKQLENNIRYYTELVETRSTAASIQLPGLSISSLSLSEAEINSLALSLSAQKFQNFAFIASDLSSTISTIPDAIIGASGPGGTAHATTIVGGQMLAKQAERLASAFRHTAGAMNTRSGMSATVAGYERRQQEWVLQKETNEMELAGLEHSIIAADLRLQMARQELRNHDLQTKHAETELEFLESKFTNQELFNWMSSRLSALYFQTYRMAYDLAKLTEKSFQRELILESSDGDQNNIIEFGYWDNLKKGLLAGESLQKDLRRLEYKYIENNARDFEITKHISLLQFAPLQLNDLKNKGKCTFWLPESIYDLDYPGHYARRIKSVNLTIPCVTGPYTTVSAKLTLEEYGIRRDTKAPDEDLSDSLTSGNFESVVTSSAQNDSGLFEFNFRDERYLPFENAGVVSKWKLELTNPKEFPAFDYQTISDVVLSINYFARDGGDHYRKQVEDNLKTRINKILPKLDMPLMRVINLSISHPDVWQRILSVAEGENVNLTVPIGAKDFPYFLRQLSIKITSATLDLVLSSPRTEEDKADLLNDLIANIELSGDILNLKEGTSIDFNFSVLRSLDFKLIKDLILKVEYTIE